jgi:hypothetical protein
MLLMYPSRHKFSNKPVSYSVYVLNDHCHRVTTQLQLINIIIIIIIIIQTCSQGLPGLRSCYVRCV